MPLRRVRKKLPGSDWKSGARRRRALSICWLARIPAPCWAKSAVVRDDQSGAQDGQRLTLNWSWMRLKMGPPSMKLLIGK